MAANICLFAQIIQQIDRNTFNSLVKKHNTAKNNEGFDSWTHLISRLFCHFAKSCSVGDISKGFYHGILGNIFSTVYN